MTRMTSLVSLVLVAGLMLPGCAEVVTLAVTYVVSEVAVHAAAGVGLAATRPRAGTRGLAKPPATVCGLAHDGGKLWWWDCIDDGPIPPGSVWLRPAA